MRRRRRWRWCEFKFTSIVMPMHVWVPVQLQFHSVSKLKNAMQQLQLVCTCNFSGQNSKEMQFFYAFTMGHLRSPLSLDMVPHHGVIGAQPCDHWRPPCCIETSSTNHPVMWCHIPEERRHQQQRKMWNWLQTSHSLHAKFHTGSSRIKSIKIQYLI
jgi:hypothetical protein